MIVQIPVKCGVVCLVLQERTVGKSWSLCTDLLTVLVDCDDWLLIFRAEGTVKVHVVVYKVCH